jgi:uncharacterized SAM-binding protein YcdF (DUF218 family)
MLDSQILKLAEKLYNYHLMKMELESSDLILLLGSQYIKVIDTAADLYHSGLAPKILISGGYGVGTQGIHNEPEAIRFKKILIEKGIKEKDLLIETESKNTGENIKFSFELIKAQNILHQKIIIITKPDMERRVYATFMKQWPEDHKPEFFVTSPPSSFNEYISEYKEPSEAISFLVGYTQRIKEYPEMGFQTPQEIPNEVWNAYEELVKAGYTKHLIKP